MYDNSKLFRKFWRSRGTKEPAYITVQVLKIISIAIVGTSDGKGKLLHMTIEYWEVLKPEDR